jgi:hypothetical protein
VPLARAIDAIQRPLRKLETWVMRTHQKIEQAKKRRAGEIFHDTPPIAGTESSMMCVSIVHHMFRESGETTQRDD